MKPCSSQFVKKIQIEREISSELALNRNINSIQQQNEGFSSEQQQSKEINIILRKEVQQQQKQHKIYNGKKAKESCQQQQQQSGPQETYKDGFDEIQRQFRKNIEPAAEIKTKQYSLLPDMATGWKPRFHILMPISLTFDNDNLDWAIENLIKSKTYSPQKRKPTVLNNEKQQQPQQQRQLQLQRQQVKASSSSKDPIPLQATPNINIISSTSSVVVDNGPNMKISSTSTSTLVSTSTDLPSTAIMIPKSKPSLSSLSQVFPVELVYLGPRYESTYSAWYQKGFPFPYTHLNKSKRFRFTDRSFIGQYWYAQTENHLRFNSFYESANLDVALKVDHLEYDLFMRVDANTRGHLQWYNFKVKNMKKDTKYQFNLCNCQKGKTLYTRGMKPFVYSQKKFQNQKIGWCQTGENIKYEKRISKFVKNTTKKGDQEPPKHYILSFEYECKYDQDQVQFSYCIPYEYSKLKQFLDQMENQSIGKNFFKQNKMCCSLGGLEIPIVTITKNLDERGEPPKKQKAQINVPQNEKQPENTQNLSKQKKLIFICARVHPGQSNSSFVMEGLIRFLCSEEAEGMRQTAVFKCVPMINPDGVVMGNYRTSLSGSDLNRQFVDPDQMIFPEVYHLKQRVRKYKELYKNDFFLYLDLHGHSTKKNVFSYGPQFPITNSSYYESRILPKLISSITDMFRYFSCIFRISEGKERTARAVLIRQLGVKLFFTIQTSNGCYYNQELMEDITFNSEHWLNMGRHIAAGIGKQCLILKQIEVVKARKKEERDTARKNRLKVKNVILRQKLQAKEKILSHRNRKPQDYLAVQSLSSNPGQQPISAVRKQQIGSLSSSKRYLPKSQYKISKQKRKQKDQSSSALIDEFGWSSQNNMMILPCFQDQGLNEIMQSIYRQGEAESRKIQKNKKYTGDMVQQMKQVQNYQQNVLAEDQVRSDDEISQGGSDSSSASQDLSRNLKKQLFTNIKKGNDSKLMKTVSKIHSRPQPIKSQFKSQTGMSLPDTTSGNREVKIHEPFQVDLPLKCMLRNQYQISSPQKSDSNQFYHNFKQRRYIPMKKQSHRINSAATSSPVKTNEAKVLNFEFSLEPIPSTNIKGVPDAHSFSTEKSDGRLFHKMINPSGFSSNQRQTRTANIENPFLNINGIISPANQSEELPTQQVDFNNHTSIERKTTKNHHHKYTTSSSFNSAVKERKKMQRSISNMSGSANFQTKGRLSNPNFYKHLKQGRLMSMGRKREQSQEPLSQQCKLIGNSTQI